MRNAQEFSKLGANIKILCNVSSQVHGRLKVKGYFVKTWKSALCKAYFKRTEKKKKPITPIISGPWTSYFAV